MKKLLIIEDNEMMMMFLANYFGKTYHVELATTPAEGIQLLNETPAGYDLVISDYKSQNHEEYQNLKEISTRLKWQNVPMIVLTDEDKSQERLEALSMGVRDTLSKPFNPKELNLRIESLLIQSESFQPLRKVA